MTQYDATMPNVTVAFKPQSLTNTFGEYIAEKGLTQLRIAETEKYAHVTFFFNGGVEKEYKMRSVRSLSHLLLQPMISSLKCRRLR